MEHLSVPERDLALYPGGTVVGWPSRRGQARTCNGQPQALRM